MVECRLRIRFNQAYMCRPFEKALQPGLEVRLGCVTHPVVFLWRVGRPLHPPFIEHARCDFVEICAPTLSAYSSAFPTNVACTLLVASFLPFKPATRRAGGGSLISKLSGVELAILMQKSCPDCKVLLFVGQANTSNLLEAARSYGHSFSKSAVTRRSRGVKSRGHSSLQAILESATLRPCQK
jgi:hypothetical protein